MRVKPQKSFCGQSEAFVNRPQHYSGFSLNREAGPLWSERPCRPGPEIPLKAPPSLDSLLDICSK